MCRSGNSSGNFHFDLGAGNRLLCKTSVNSDLQQLLIYQQYDCKLLELEKLSERLRRESEALRRRRLSADEKLQTKLAERTETQKKLRLAELELKEIVAAVKSLDGRSSRVKTSLQRAAIGDEEIALDIKKSACEERCIALMESCEIVEAELGSCRRDCYLSLKSIDGQLDSIAARRIELDGGKEAVKEMMSHLRKNIGKNWLGAYDDLRKSNLLPPYVCRLDTVRCTGCHMHTAANGGDCDNSPLRRCEFCNRIIYDDKGMDDIEQI